MPIHFVTIATKMDGYMKFFLESCKMHNVNINVLGFGKKWLGFGWRWMLVKKFLIDKEDDDIVCFLDSYDLIVNKSVEDLESVFRSLGTEFLVSRETQAHMLLDFSLKFLSKCFSSKWESIDNVLINAGTWMSTKRAFMKMLNEVRTNPEYKFSLSSDDQGMLCRYIKNNRDLVKIDMENKVFLVSISPFFGFFYNKDITFDGEKILFRGNPAFFIHCPAKANMNEVIQLFGYQMTKEEIVNGKSAEDMYRKILFSFLFFLMILLISRKFLPLVVSKLSPSSA